ncbi:hypothetical protein CURE108131_00205 [Cupriavidus respiraculi]|uniref:Uncharacterized protein n=1 Tax=Cupriavidus respiraculi TaxID=195930 RepID=A0ABN7Z548_9BURK|nr:hypothetical protein [Cupriavidus respiraculi]CAG9179189.1 hypothetical protein LMG21510_03713 [Cupriavidus respiraculi]
MEHLSSEPNRAAGASRFANLHCARRAVQMALPMLEAAVRDRDVGESGFLHVVVMDPARHPSECTFEEAILHEFSTPGRERWDADYAWYAREKARVSWRTGLASDHVQARFPHLLREGESMLGGAAVHHGIVVAVSGANPWFDEAFAECVASLMRGIAQSRLRQALAG